MKRVTALLLSGLILLICSCGAVDTENGMQADNGETATQTEQAVTEVGISIDDAKRLASEHWGISGGDTDSATGFRFAIFAQTTDRGDYHVWLSWLVDGHHYSKVDEVIVDADTGELIDIGEYIKN